MLLQPHRGMEKSAAIHVCKYWIGPPHGCPYPSWRNIRNPLLQHLSAIHLRTPPAVICSPLTSLLDLTIAVVSSFTCAWHWRFNRFSVPLWHCPTRRHSPQVTWIRPWLLPLKLIGPRSTDQSLYSSRSPAVGLWFTERREWCRLPSPLLRRPV